MYVYMHRHTYMYTYITYAYLCTQLCTHMDAYANEVDIYLHKSASLGPALVHCGLQGTACPLRA